MCLKNFSSSIVSEAIECNLRYDKYQEVRIIRILIPKPIKKHSTEICFLDYTQSIIEKSNIIKLKIK